MEFIN